MRIIYSLLIVILWLTFLPAQNISISGRLIDQDGEAISGANISVRGTVRGAASDLDGYFYIRGLPPGTFQLTVYMIGFTEKDTTLVLEEGLEIKLGNLVLRSSPLQAQPIVVTASKYEQSVQDVPASIYTLTSAQMELRNTVSVKDALEYAPGVNMNADQVNIRGSSGYSRGVGSRVMVLVDGVPFITGDTQGAVFEALPINNVDRVEIIKGAGSSLYGSSAIGGVINIITKPIDSDPVLNAKMYAGLYDDPYYSQWKWSDKTRILNGVQFDYARKLGNVGLKVAAARDGDDSYRKNDWHRRYNAGGKMEIDLSPFDLLTVSGNYMDQKRGNFLYWQGIQNALVPAEDQIGETVHSKRFYISTRYRKLFDAQKFLKTDVMWFQNRFDDNVGIGNRSTSDFLHLELQYNTVFKKHYFTLGITPSYSRVSSNIFGSRNGYGFASYVQDEIKFSEKIILTAGIRFDTFDIDELNPASQFSPKLALVYKPQEGSALRANVGSGFRAPSMAEAFTSTVAGGLIVEPNTALKPEQSLSAEIGWNQYLNEYVVADISTFFNYFWDLIEGGFQESGNIQFENITEARILGFETSAQGRLFNNRILLAAAYTYIDTRDINNGDFLKYRPRHLLYLSGRFNWKIFTLGLDYRFLSRYDRIDDSFALIIPDAEERVSAQIFDIQFTADLQAYIPAVMRLQINNVFQYNYIDLIGSIAPIRNFVFALETSL